MSSCLIKDKRFTYFRTEPVDSERERKLGADTKICTKLSAFIYKREMVTAKSLLCEGVIDDVIYNRFCASVTGSL